MRLKTIIAVIGIAMLCMGASECDLGEPESSSGVKQRRIDVQTNAQGVTAEQSNVGNRLLEDNKPGSIKHLYIISAYSGQVLIYSTVKGKVTSGSVLICPIAHHGGAL